MFERDAVCGDLHHAGVGVDLDPRFFQRVFDKLANLFAHTRHQPVGHFDDYDARFAMQRAPLHRIAQQIGHLRR